MDKKNITLPPLLRSVYPSLTKKEKRLADYIAEHLPQLGSLTLNDLATTNNVSVVTISRFCKKLGFLGLNEFKLALVQQQVQDFNGSLDYHNIGDEDDYATVAEKIVNNIATSLADTIKLLNPAEIEKAVRLLSNARSICVYGYGGSSTVCTDIEVRFMRFGIPIHAYSDTDLALTSASLLSEEDVVLAVSHTGATKDLLECLHIAHGKGANIIVITSQPRSPVAKMADVVLTGVGREVNYRSEASASRFAHFAIADILYTALAMSDLRGYKENMKHIRSSLRNIRI